MASGKWAVLDKELEEPPKKIWVWKSSDALFELIFNANNNDDTVEFVPNSESYQSCPSALHNTCQPLNLNKQNCLWHFLKLDSNFRVKMSKTLMTKISFKLSPGPPPRSARIFFAIQGKFEGTHDPFYMTKRRKNSNNGNRLLLKDDLQCLKLPVGGGIRGI